MNKQRQEDMLIGAYEGGSNYWAELSEDALEIIKKYRKSGRAPSEQMFDAIQAGESIPIEDSEEGGVIGYIDKASIKRAMTIMEVDYPVDYANIISENDDCNTADIFFQLAVMGEVVFG